MLPTTSPITDHAVTVSRSHPRPLRSATRNPASPLQHRFELPAANQDVTYDPRQRVIQAFRDMAHGVAAPVARAKTTDFYRSGGQEWAHSLTAQGGSALKARVIEAFRDMAHGVPDIAAHASTLRFYRSGGRI